MDFPFRHTPSTFVDVARIVDALETVLSSAIVNNRPDKKRALAEVLVDFTQSLLALFPNDLIATDFVSLGAPPLPNCRHQDPPHVNLSSFDDAFHLLFIFSDAFTQLLCSSNYPKKNALSKLVLEFAISLFSLDLDPRSDPQSQGSQQ